MCKSYLTNSLFLFKCAKWKSNYTLLALPQHWHNSTRSRIHVTVFLFSSLVSFISFSKAFCFTASDIAFHLIWLVRWRPAKAGASCRSLRPAVAWHSLESCAWTTVFRCDIRIDTLLGFQSTCNKKVQLQLSALYCTMIVIILCGILKCVLLLKHSRWLLLLHVVSLKFLYTVYRS